MTQEIKRQQKPGEYDINRIVDITSKLTDRQRIADIKRSMLSKAKVEKHSLSAVAEIKTYTDTKDSYYIFRINDQNMNGQPSFVFKTSRQMAEIAIQMDQSASNKSALKEEYCYFDGMHRRCEGWKTLTLWVFHSPSRKLLRLASMEVKGETSKMVALFWKSFAQVVSNVKGHSYLFNPKGFLVDEAGCNFKEDTKMADISNLT